DRIRRIRLSGNPWFQKAVATFLLVPNYYTPPFVRIRLEGEDRLPDGPVIFAMNHTDRYNYWPLQFALWRRLGRFTAAWVKGKYYEHPLMGLFMELVNSIPTVSRGYIITRDFRGALGRRPTNEEYAAARSWVDGQAARLGGDPIEAPTGELPGEILEQPRSILGREFDPARESYADAVNALFQEMMRRFVELNAEATSLGLDTIIFPQGTRSLRLSRGRIGISQVALAQERTIVPVGCSGCDKLYSGASPWARGGTVTYRFGEPMTHTDLKRFHTAATYEPFTPAAESAHRETFQALADHLMDRIDELVDEPYRFSDDQRSEGVEGSSRFV
ncbi:MAG: 1-acyl-sn-glycerol-3-phosphate acyltransferase, partial [Myxococcota bacterium]|nr:1-acyl-sn-glycerol-3-phosphate acyltransferase [Myxococcota bacterium]